MFRRERDRERFMSEEDGTADCSHMILAPVGLQSFLSLHRRTRGSRARATPASDTIRGQRRHSPTHPNLATSRQPPQHCGETTLFFPTRLKVNAKKQTTGRIRYHYLPSPHEACLGHMLWPEEAFPNAFTIGNDTTVESILRWSCSCL